MNFKTTIVLVILVLVLGGYLFFTRDRGSDSESSTSSGNERKLLDVSSTDVTKLVITPSSGPCTVLEKSNATWKLTEPVAAPAETFELDSLIRAVADLKSRGQAKQSPQTPQYKIALTAS